MIARNAGLSHFVTGQIVDIGHFSFETRLSRALVWLKLISIYFQRKKNQDEIIEDTKRVHNSKKKIQTPSIRSIEVSKSVLLLNQRNILNCVTIYFNWANIGLGISLNKCTIFNKLDCVRTMTPMLVSKQVMESEFCVSMKRKKKDYIFDTKRINYNDSMNIRMLKKHTQSLSVLLIFIGVEIKHICILDTRANKKLCTLAVKVKQIDRLLVEMKSRRAIISS